jgi:hypothetical protein
MVITVYPIVVLVLLVILFLGLVYLAIVTHRNIHARSDPARTAFPYFRSTLHLFLGGTLFSLITVALVLFLGITSNYDDDDRTVNAINHLSITSSLLNYLASCTLIFTIAHLATGVRRAASGGSYNPRKIHLTINILAGLAALLWVAFFIERQVRSGGIYSGGIVRFVFAILALTGFALLLVAAITVLVYSYRVRKALKQLAVGAEYLPFSKQVVAVAWVNMVLFAWMIVSGILSGLTMGAFVGFWDIIDVGVRYFGMLGLLVGIYYLGKKQKGGLWSGGIEGVPLAAAAARSNEA